MKQKIEFERSGKKNSLKVSESAEVDPGVVQLLHEETYDLERIRAAHKAGFEPFCEELRRKSLFPAHPFMVKIYEGCEVFLNAGDTQKTAIEFNDIESFPDEDGFKVEDEVEDEVELDAILEEDGDTKENEIKEIDSEEDTPRFELDDDSEHEK